MRKLLISLALFAGLTSQASAQNYQATAGTGTTFGTKLVSAVNYPQFVVCDPTTPAQCAAVDASGRLSIIPNTAINIAQINGVTVLMGNGATGTGSQRVTLANDNTLPTGWPTPTQVQTVTTWAGGTLGAMAAYGTSPGAVLVPGANVFVTNTLAAVGNNVSGVTPAAANSSPVVNYNYVYNGATWDPQTASLAVLDPCQNTVKSTLPITLATAAVKVIAAGVAAKKVYVCHLYLNNNAADTIAVFEATTGTTCATSAVAMIGAGTSVATAGTGQNFGATGGINMGTGGNQVLVTTVNNNDVCIAQSAATQLSGTITYVTK